MLKLELDFNGEILLTVVKLAVPLVLLAFILAVVPANIQSAQPAILVKEETAFQINLWILHVLMMLAVQTVKYVKIISVSLRYVLQTLNVLLEISARMVDAERSLALTLLVLVVERYANKEFV
jgi:hypothetical protein